MRRKKQATTTPALTRQKLNQDRGKLTSPYQTLLTNISGNTGSVHMKDQRETINRPSNRIQKPSSTRAVEANIVAPDKGVQKA